MANAIFGIHDARVTQQELELYSQRIKSLTLLAGVLSVLMNFEQILAHLDNIEKVGLSAALCLNLIYGVLLAMILPGGD